MCASEVEKEREREREREDVGGEKLKSEIGVSHHPTLTNYCRDTTTTTTTTTTTISTLWYWIKTASRVNMTIII